MARAVLLLWAVLHHSAAFSLLQHRTNAPLQQRTNAPTAMRGSDDDALDASSPDAFIAGLMNRVGDLKSRQLELPIVVLDATLPNQQLAISTSDQAFREMVEYCGVKAVEEAGDEQFDDTRHGKFGIVGVDRQTGNAFPFGVEAIILKASVASETCSVELKGGRRFTVDETQDEAPAGAVQPRKVTLAPELDDDDEAAAVAAAQRLPALVEEWEKLVVDGGHERQPDHLGLVRGHLGPMPGPERPSDLALWVGAYVWRCVEINAIEQTHHGDDVASMAGRLKFDSIFIQVNPLPALGVALEIRPLLLRASTAKERVDAAVAGIASSIAHLDGTRRLW